MSDEQDARAVKHLKGAADFALAYGVSIRVIPDGIHLCGETGQRRTYSWRALKDATENPLIGGIEAVSSRFEGKRK